MKHSFLFFALWTNKICSGFLNPTSVLPTLTSLEANVDKNNEPEPMARTARVIAPLSSFTASLGWNVQKAYGAPTDKSDLSAFDEALDQFFPGSLTNTDTSIRVATELTNRGYRPSNVLLGSSLCSDEVNYIPDSFIVKLQNKITNVKKGGVFEVGGLGGLPFVGTSGFGAFLSHCPDQGKVVLVFGPHVGISEDGVVGKVKRIGVRKVSTSCGAAVGAYKAIVAGAGQPSNPFDYEEEYIIENLKQKLGKLASKESTGDDAMIALVTKKMYEIILDLVLNEIEGAISKPEFFDKVNEITLIGGIVVNRDPISGGDGAFQPLMMKSYNSLGEINLYDKVFGPTKKTSFDKSLKQYFPGSITSSETASRVALELFGRNYRSSNILIGSSLCSDEINYTAESFITKLQKKLIDPENGGVFEVGGLGGLPFVGKSGFGAFLSHCPDQGKILLVFGPHIGVSESGVVGKVKRLGLERESGACGAAIGAYKQIAAASDSQSNNIFDLEEEYIITNLKERLGVLSDKERQGGDAMISLVTAKMYEIILELTLKEIQSAISNPDFWTKANEITLVGGVVINRDHIAGGEDAFQPLYFKSFNKEGEVDLYEKVFGDLKATTIVSKEPESTTTKTVEASFQQYVSGVVTGSVIAFSSLKLFDNNDNDNDNDSNFNDSSGPKISPSGTPTINQWTKNRDGSISGFVKGSSSYGNNESITTSPVRGNVSSGNTVITSSGSK